MEWLIATTVAAVTMVGYASSYVYTRNEGEKLEALQIRDVDRLEKKIDWIIEFLSAQKKR